MKASRVCSARKTKNNPTLKMNQTKLNRIASGQGDFAALIGLDWASQKHALCLCDCATAKRENSILEHTPEAIAHWARGLDQRCGGKKIALCLEQAKGPLIYALLGVFLLCPLSGQPRHSRALPSGL